MWGSIKLTLYGKINIIKSLAIPQMLFSMTTLGCPDSYLKQVNRLFYNFLWNKGIDKIERKTMIGEYKNGGMNMPDIFILQKSLYESWTRRLFTSDNAKWKATPFNRLEQF